MQKIIVIIGLPWAGKTTYIQNNFEKSKNILICDDYHKSSYNKSHKFEDSIYYKDMENGLKKGKDIVLADIARCKPERKEQIEIHIKNTISKLKITAEIVFMYFENNPNACKKNILERNREKRAEREIEFIDRVSSKYKIPKNTIVLPIKRKT